LAADPTATLLYAMGLHEPDSRQPIPLTDRQALASRDGVVLDGETAVAVNFATAGVAPPNGWDAELVQVPPPAAARPRGEAPRATPDAATTAPAAPGMAAARLEAWPRLDAPTYVPARKPFEVIVGLADAPQAAVTGGRVTLAVPAGAEQIDVQVELIADGLDAPDGWSRTLGVQVAKPTKAEVVFQLVGRDPKESEVHLTTLEIRYVLDGSICGTATRPLVIGKADRDALGPPPPFGTPWLAQPPAGTPVSLLADGRAADLTIELAKPDRNATLGHYVCRLYSPHALTVGTGPWEIDLGQDAKTFAKTVVDQVRLYGPDPIVDNTLRSFAGAVADRLPSDVFDALREVAARCAPAPPAVLVVSAEPYVPWELTLIDPPLDQARPPFLGAQALVGRWLRESTPIGPLAGAPARAPRPPAEPPAKIGVRHMAVMAGMYRAESGLRNLPQAENEATTLLGTFNAVPLAASLQALKQLLDAKLEHNFQAIGGADAVHFAGHGDFDPTRPDGSVLFLSDGRPLSSLLFRSANYGGPQQPLIFLNACMIGIGGELLGDMGGFPGNCLKGGFGGVLGALWEVDDLVARDVALEFWQRALPASGTPEPVAAILRDLRAKYSAGPAAAAPIATYLAYVYYGHPRLTLERSP
jgi:hypothetical protein